MPSDKNACLQCRRVKMRCRLIDRGDGICERCARKSLECVFREHRRGRKPGTRVANKKKKEIYNQEVLPVPTGDHVSSNEPTRVDSDIEGPPNTSSLQPAGLLNREAMRGKFSLQNILSPDSHDSGNVREEYPSIPTQDVITRGLINLVLAESLFESFINVLNPYISQLDPILHTFSYVRRRSSFLLNSILAASAKIYNPALYKNLHKNAEDLYLDSVRTGRKSAETVQAILILTYWKEPEDTRAWLTLGYVIRMCMDLGWHKLTPKSTPDRQAMTEKQNRELRNVERTWLVLFVYDRSMSLQTGKPWMIERSEFIETSETWGKDTLANDNDVLLCAFVTLRLMASEAFGLLSHRGSLQSMESLLTVLSARIDKWEGKWLQVLKSKSDSCHPFLIQFYGTHLRLQLFSLPLQKALGSMNHETSYNFEALWVSYSNAIEMLNLISRFSSRLYFAQDSIHIMTAYSAAFLIKLLLSAPSSIVDEIQQVTTEAICVAARVFSQQAAPPGSSCFLQAKFLENIVLKFEEVRSKTRPGSHSLGNETNCNIISNAKSGMTTSGTTSKQMNTATVDRSPREHVPARTEPSRTAASYDATYSTFLPGGSPENEATETEFSDMMESAGPEYTFMDDETWATMFASAGFSLEEGIFFS